MFGSQPELVPGSPVTWLDPRAGIVPAQDRPEVSELLDWRTGRAGPVLRLVCGQGGQGKTRLALTLCDQLASDSPATASRRPWQRQRWRNVTDIAAAGTVDPKPLALASLPASRASTGASEAAVTGQLWEAAVEAFADRAVAANLLSGVPGAVAALTAHPPGRFETTLDLYADALLRVLDRGAAPADRAGAGDDPLRGLLHHERRLFARGAGLTWLDTGLRRDLAVSVAFLHPAAGMHAATRALAAVPELSQPPYAELERTAQALAVAYPAEPRHPISDWYVLRAAITPWGCG